MCDERRLYVIEYVEHISEKFGYEYNFVSKIVDKVYNRIGDRIFSSLDKIEDIFATYKGKGSLEEKIFTSLQLEAFQ